MPAMIRTCSVGVLVVAATLAVAGVCSAFDSTADLRVAIADTPDPVVAGSMLEYVVTVQNLGPGIARSTQLALQLDPAITAFATVGCAEDPAGAPVCTIGNIGPAATFRVTEVAIPPGAFISASYNLDLPNDLASDYFVLLSGSSDGVMGGDEPRENHARLAGDPWGTGDLSASGASDRLMFKRGTGGSDWAGVATVVECLSDCDAGGFRLLTVAEIQLPADDGATTGSRTAPVPWGDPGRIMIPGGPNGAGCETDDPDVGDHPVCHVRVVPSGVATLEWSRDTTTADLSAGATVTAPVIRWGSEWTVQRVRVQTDAGADGAASPAAYGTAAIATVDRAATWVWGCGHTAGNAGGTSADGVLIALGDGVSVQPVETSVAVGIEHPGLELDFEVWALSHPDLAVDHVFKADGDAASTSVPVAVSAADPEARMALAFNGLESTVDGYPQALLGAAYTADDQITLSRRQAGAAFPAWVQGVDLSAIRSSANDRQVTITAAVSPAAPTSLSSTVTVSSDASDPDPSNNTAVASTAVSYVADLSVSLVDDLDPVIAGRAITYTGSVANAGPSDAATTVATTILTPSLTAVETVGCAEDPFGVPLCSLGTVPSGGAAPFSIVAVTPQDARGAVAITASAVSSASDPDPTDNSDVEGTRLTGEIPIGRGGAPAISGDLGGTARLAVAWESDSTTEATDRIFARIYDADGMPVGVELEVAGGDGSVRGESDVAFTAGGEFVVVWQEDGADADGFGIVARRFDADGMPVGVEYPVNSSTANSQVDPAIAADGDGTVVAWVDEISLGSFEHAVRRFDAAGMPVGVELRFGAADIDATPPAIAVAPGGEFLVVWESPTDRIAGQRFGVDGMPVGVELEIDSGAGTAAGFPAVAWHPSGVWLVAWQSDADGDANGIFARFVGVDGMPVGVELQVNTAAAGDQTHPDVAVDGAGEFAIVWQSDDPVGERVLARRFSSSGMPVGVELQVDRSLDASTSRPGVAYVADGEYYVAWQTADSDGDGSDEIVGGRQPLVFADGFESGDLGAWSSSAAPP